MARPRQQRGEETATRILDLAELLVQQRGFNGFSYRDIGAELGLTTATLHYHFPTKAELGTALITRYASRFAEALGGIAATHRTAPARLDAYIELYARVLRESRLCLCGMLAAEFGTLPESMREAVLAFFETNETWLAGVLTQGRDAGEVRFAGEPMTEARMIVGGLEGAMLLARPYRDVERFQTAAQCLISGLRGRIPAV